MSTLCGTCSSLTIDEDIVADLRKRTQGIINDEAIAYIAEKLQSNETGAGPIGVRNW
jgi:hypothetical protein